MYLNYFIIFHRNFYNFIIRSFKFVISMPRTREIAFIFIRLIKNYSPKFMYARITFALLFVAYSRYSARRYFLGSRLSLSSTSLRLKSFVIEFCPDQERFLECNEAMATFKDARFDSKLRRLRLNIVSNRSGRVVSSGDSESAFAV